VKASAPEGRNNRYRGPNTLGLVEQRPVRKPDHPVAPPFQRLGPGGVICLLLTMLLAVELDHQAGLHAKEVGEELIDRNLAAELPAFEAPPRSSFQSSRSASGGSWRSSRARAVLVFTGED